MKLIEKIRTNNIFKFLFYIFLLLIIFNQVISYGVVSIYNNIQNDKQTTENYKNLNTNTEFIQESISEIFKKKSK
jgi:high-affinity nickel permease